MAHRSHWRLRRFAQPQRAPQPPHQHSAPPPHPDGTLTPPTHEAKAEGELVTRADPSDRQPLKGFDYSFGAVG